MKNFRRIVKLVSLLSLVLIMGIFTNMTTRETNYEVDYVDGSGIPFSEIVEATFAELTTPKPNSQQVSKPRMIVEIKANEIAFLDRSIEVDELIINGQLHCDNTFGDPSIELKAETIYVNGVFQCGQKLSPYSKKLTVSLKHNGAINPRQSDKYRALIVNNGGRMSLTGNRKNAGWYRLGATALPGDNFITFPRELINTATDRTIVPIANIPWSVGDEIVVGPTSYKGDESETFRITAIQGNRIYLNGTLTKTHLGEKETYATTYNGTVSFDPRAEIANLTRNIKIQPDESLGAIPTTETAPYVELGGHVMVMRGGSAFVDSVEFYHMGQAGIMARYPFHWHWVGDAANQFIKNSSVHHSFQRCITIHRTNKALVDNNVCYYFKGHGYFVEDGVEVDNVISNNLGIHSRFPYPSKVLLASDHPTVNNEATGRFPNVATFWISHPQNTVVNNVASGYVGSGFWMAFETEIKNSQGTTIAYPIWTDTKIFERNTAHSGLVGFTWDGAPIGALTNNPNNPNDRKLEINTYNPGTTPIFRNLVSFKNKLTGYYFRGTTAVFEGGVSADNTRHYWLAYNQIVRNSVVIARSKSFSTADQQQAIVNNRPDRYMQAGIAIYDGPFELDGVDFLNYPTQKVYSGSIEVTPIPISAIFSFERLHNTAKRVAFNPSPIHRIYVIQGDAHPYSEYSRGIVVRDLDGTLTGAPGNLVGRKSLAVLNESSCVNLQDLALGLKRCPASHTETFLQVFPGEGQQQLGWTAPYVVRRSDGVLSFEKTNWNQAYDFPYSAGHIFTLNNSSQLDYEIMFKGIQKPEFGMISEVFSPQTPVIKVVGQGQNCSLVSLQTSVPLPSVATLAQLRSSTSSAMYSQGNDVYFRLIPKSRHWTIRENNGNQGSAMRYGTDYYQVNCSSPSVPYVTGYLDSVRKNSDGSVKIRGWACNHTSPTPVQVAISTFAIKAMKPQLTQIATGISNLPSEAAVNFACGIPSTAGYRFEITVPASIASANTGRKVIATGISNTGGQNFTLINSSTLTMP